MAESVIPMATGPIPPQFHARAGPRGRPPTSDYVAGVARLDRGSVRTGVSILPARCTEQDISGVHVRFGIADVRLALVYELPSQRD